RMTVPPLPDQTRKQTNPACAHQVRLSKQTSCFRRIYFNTSRVSAQQAKRHGPRCSENPEFLLRFNLAIICPFYSRGQVLVHRMLPMYSTAFQTQAGSPDCFRAISLHLKRIRTVHSHHLKSLLRLLKASSISATSKET